MVIYRGPSLIDGQPIVVVAIMKSTNSKTGDMLQTYILVDNNEKPLDNVRNGADASICGGCIHRGDGTGKGRTCYVNLGQGARSVFQKLGSLNTYPIARTSEDISAIGKGRYIRLGTYGDPAAVPVAVWHALLKYSIGHTGYTHQWRSKRLGAPLAGLVMASCDTPDDIAKAHAMGFTGTFTVVPFGTNLTGGVLCPASAEAGRVAQCQDCRLCNGSNVSVWIPAHGATRKNYTGSRTLPVI